MKVFSSDRASKFTESVIREMTRVCFKHNGVNLAQGFPDFPAPEAVKDAARSAIAADACARPVYRLRQSVRYGAVSTGSVSTLAGPTVAFSCSNRLMTHPSQLLIRWIAGFGNIGAIWKRCLKKSTASL